MTAGPVTAPTVAAPRGTIGNALSGRDNALNFVRLVLASAVIVGHTWPLGGFGSSAWEGISGAAVNGFFAISGYLIAGSRVRLSFLGYLWRRTLRIMPAFWVCLALTAFVFAPLTAAFNGERWVPGSALSYLTENALLRIGQWGIDDTLQSVPYAGVWNGSLWTLMFEFAAYLVAGAVLSVALVRRHRAVGLFFLLAAVLVILALARGPLAITTNLYLNGLRLAAFFVAGMALWSVAKKLPSTAWLGVPAIALVLATSQLPDVAYQVTSTLPMAYAVLWLGSALPVRLGVTNDLSYGIYIYAFPVQQMLAVVGAPAALGFWGYAVAAWLLTVPLAAASWWLVEKPAMTLRRLVPL